MPLSGFLDVVDAFNIMEMEMPVVALNFDNPKTLQNNIKLLRYILETNEDGEDFIASYENLKNEITEKTNRLSDDEKPRVFIWYFDYDYENCYKTVGRDAPGIQAQFDIAGANNIFANEAGVFPEIDPNRLAGEDIDAIVCLISPAVIQDIFGYEIEHPKLANKIKNWVMNQDENPALAEITAVHNGEVYLIQNEMIWSPRHVVALTTKAKWFHPGFFMDLDRQTIHQQYLDILNIDYNFDESGIFYWWGVLNIEGSDYGSTEGVDTVVYSSASMKLCGLWDQHKQEYIYNGYLCGGGAVRIQTDKFQNGWGCFDHYIRIKEKENKENFYFVIETSNPERMGCVPYCGEEEDYSSIDNVLEAIANVMINQMGKYVEFAWAVASPFIDDLVSGIDTEELENEQLLCEFNYPSDRGLWPTDVGCWYWWKVITKPDQTIKFDIYISHMGLANNNDGYYVEHCWTPTLNIPPPFPGEFSIAERIKYGIREIPVSEIEEHAMEFGLSSATVNTLVKQGEPIYIVTDGIVIEKHPTKVFKTDLASYKSEFDRRANNE